MTKSVNGVGGTIALHLDRRDREARIAFDRQTRHREPMPGVAYGLALLVGRLPRRNEADFFETERRRSFLGCNEMGDVDRVKRSTHDPDASAHVHSSSNSPMK